MRSRGGERSGGARSNRKAATRPYLDGYPTADHGRLRSDAPHQGRRFAALNTDHRVTSYALSGEGQRAREAGCDDYVPKPYSPRELLAKIRQYLQ